MCSASSRQPVACFADRRRCSGVRARLRLNSLSAYCCSAPTRARVGSSDAPTSSSTAAPSHEMAHRQITVAIETTGVAGRPAWRVHDDVRPLGLRPRLALREIATGLRERCPTLGRHLAHDRSDRSPAKVRLLGLAHSCPPTHNPTRVSLVMQPTSAGGSSGMPPLCRRAVYHPSTHSAGERGEPNRPITTTLAQPRPCPEVPA